MLLWGCSSASAGGNLAGPHHLTDQRVVFGQLGQGAGAPEIGPAVTNMGQDYIATADDRRGQRRSPSSARDDSVAANSYMLVFMRLMSRVSSSSGDFVWGRTTQKPSSPCPRRPRRLRSPHAVSHGEDRGRANSASSLDLRTSPVWVTVEKVAGIRYFRDSGGVRPSRLRSFLETEDRVADDDLLPRLDLVLALYAAAVDEGAVGTAQVLKKEELLADEDTRMRG